MSRPDTAAAAALDAQVIRPVFLVYLDIMGDPVRANSSGTTITLTGTGDPDIDGFAFDGVSPDFVDIGSVAVNEGGSDSLIVSLSGLPVLDEETLDQIGDKANWQGREARLWRIIRNANGEQQGSIQHYYTGYMTSLDIKSASDSQIISLSIESYLAAFSAASNRTYQNQQEYDPGDQSARAMIAIANGTSTSNITPGGGAGGGFGGRIARDALAIRNASV